MSTTFSHVWRPSAARRLEIDGFVPLPRGPVAVPVAPLAWPAKDPSDTLDYVFDIAPAVAGNGGDVIASLSVAVTPNAPGDLIAQSLAADGTLAIVWLAGGQPGTTYTVTLAIATASGRTIARSILLPVTALATTAPVTNALTTPLGLALTDPSGTPLTIN
jgi:hypothetical protein